VPARVTKAPAAARASKRPGTRGDVATVAHPQAPTAAIIAVVITLPALLIFYFRKLRRRWKQSMGVGRRASQ
jgi:hypothetical protein